MTIKSVIFDMDGVLVDSEPVYQQHIYLRLLPRYPWLKPEDLYPMAGMSSTEDKPFLARLARRDASDLDFLREIEDIYASCRMQYVELMRPQAPEVLRELKGMGLTLALASSNTVPLIDQMLSECGLQAYFDVAVSGDAFRESKPNPEIYLHTMERLGRLPEECLIVEDSPYGIEAGVAAGGKVAAFRDTHFLFDQSRAHFHIGSLAEIPALVCGEASRSHCIL